MTIETLTRTVPAEPTTPIKPSEAIRLGCLIAPMQAFGGIGKRGLTACALMALDLGSGGNLDTFRAFAVAPMTCPECGLRDSGGRIVIRLNDAHHWSREHIADWLEGLGL